VSDAPLARFKDLCLDAADPDLLGPWWAEVLGLSWQPWESGGGGAVVGPTPGHTIWVVAVPEPKSVKHRVHLDIYTQNVADLEALGATRLEQPDEGRHWTVLGDPDGGEFCAMVRAELPADRLHGVVVDSVDPVAIATWWAETFGAALDTKGPHWATLEQVPGMPILTMDFNRVPEPKTVKNRIHWDVFAPDVEALVARGAVVLRRPDEDVDWTVLADPEGNEFCAFAPRD